MDLIRKLIILFLFFALIFAWSYLPIEYLLKFTNDDSYFYLKTALVFAREGKSSFDGINLTNGYHPLWFILLSFVYKFCLILGLNSGELLLRITFIFTSLINLVSLLFVYKFTKGSLYLINKSTHIIIYLLLIPLVLFYLIGLEVQIFILTLIILIYLLSKVFKGETDKILKVFLSFIFSILFLARVDLFWYVIATILFFLIVRNKKLLKAQLKLFIIPLLIFVAYILINKLIFHTYYPISSYYKFSLNVSENLKFFPLPLKDPINFSVLMLIIFFTLFYYLTGTSRITKNYDDIKLLEYLNMAFFLFLIVNFLLNSNGVREWYYTFPMFTSILLFIFSINKIRYHNLIILSVIIFNIFYFLIFRTNYYNHNSAYKFAQRVKELLPKDSIIFQVDYSGLISFFSDMQIINGDGLINSFDYYKTLKEGKLSDYLKKVKPDYIIFYSFENPHRKDTIIYKVRLLSNVYEIRIPNKDLILNEPLLYGGIFRRKVGNFYLLKLNEYKIISY